MGLVFLLYRGYNIIGATIAAPVLGPTIQAGIAAGAAVATGVGAYYAYKGYRKAVVFAKRSRELFKPGGPLNPLPLRGAPGPDYTPSPKLPKGKWGKVLYFGTQILHLIKRLIAPFSF
jgi:hypothetical protein